jgi:threonine/homoserine/homoserine lactone efflux protein
VFGVACQLFATGFREKYRDKGHMDFLWLILSGVGMGLIAAVPVGPVNLICIRRTFSFGPVNGFFSGLGGALGDGVFAAVTGFGLTWAAQLIEGYSVAISLIGGIMMVVMGWYSVKAGVPPVDPKDCPIKAEKDRAGSSLLKAIASTFALTITNPATLLFFTGMFAGLGSFGGGPGSFTDTSFIVLGVVAGSAGWWLILTTVIGLFHARIDGNRILAINRICGFLVAIFGLAVLVNLSWNLLKQV